MTINKFEGEHRFLSNFWPAPVALDMVIYPSVEHAYQAAKFPHHRREPFRCGSAGTAKRMGRCPGVRADWDTVKIEVMRALVKQKFAWPDLRSKLLATGTRHIEEGNTWGDVFWGTCKGQGRNELGRILMSVRADL